MVSPSPLFTAPFSRIIIGPVDSVRPYDTVRVSGELLVPVIVNPKPEFGRYFQCEAVRYGYERYMPGIQWQSAAAREYLEQTVRHNLADAFLKRFPIQMRSEVVQELRYDR